MTRPNHVYTALILTVTLAVADARAGGGTQPYSISYHGSLERDGVPLNTAIDMRFTLYDAGETCASGMFTCWRETHAGANDVVVDSGRFAVTLGELSTLSAVILESTPYLGIEVSTDGGSNWTPLNGRQLLTASPYAWRGAPGQPFQVDDRLVVPTVSEAVAGEGVEVDALRIRDGRALYDSRRYANLKIAPNPANPAHQLTVTAEFVNVEGWRFTNVNETVDITLAGDGGLDAGTEAASTWYHVWLIADTTNPAAPLLGAILSEQYPGGASPALPAGHTLKQYYGAVFNDGSMNFADFEQRGEWAIFVALDAGSTSGSTTLSLATLVPQTAVEVGGYGHASAGSTNGAGVHIAPDSSQRGRKMVNTGSAVGGAQSVVAPFRAHLTTPQSIWIQRIGAGGVSSLTITEYRLDL